MYEGTGALEITQTHDEQEILQERFKRFCKKLPELDSLYALHKQSQNDYFTRLVLLARGIYAAHVLGYNDRLDALLDVFEKKTGQLTTAILSQMMHDLRKSLGEIPSTKQQNNSAPGGRTGQKP